MHDDEIFQRVERGGGGSYSPWQTAPTRVSKAIQVTVILEKRRDVIDESVAFITAHGRRDRETSSLASWNVLAHTCTSVYETPEIACVLHPVWRSDDARQRRAGVSLS